MEIARGLAEPWRTLAPETQSWQRRYIKGSNSAIERGTGALNGSGKGLELAQASGRVATNREFQVVTRSARMSYRHIEKFVYR